ncbi:MAG TPA: hypothetical protein VF189_02470 [Patescibacteria group bacterium]
MLKKQLFSGLLIILVGLTPVVAVAPAYAATNTAVHQNFWDSLVSFFTQKFGLDQNQVKTAVTEFQAQHKAQVEQNAQNREKTRLDKLVSQGKITSSEEQAILDELSKLQQEYSSSSLQNMTPQEKRQAFKKEHQELLDWAKGQNIDPNLVLPGFGMGRGKFMMHRGWFGTSPTPTPGA